jgi:hypothetical protein
LEENTVTIEPIREDELRKTDYKALLASSGAANTVLLEPEPYYFVHGGRQAEAFEFGGNNTLVVCVGSTGSMAETQFADWIMSLWKVHRFEHIVLPLMVEQFKGWQTVGKSPPLKALSCANVEEPDCVDVSETVSFSAGLSSEADINESPWRGIYCVPHTEKMLFSQSVEIKTSELPRWKPRVIIDRHTP